MTKYPNLARNSGPHRTACALTLYALQSNDAEFEALLDGLDGDEMRLTMAALALQASTYCVRALGGEGNAIQTLRKTLPKLAGLNPEG